LIVNAGARQSAGQYTAALRPFRGSPPTLVEERARHLTYNGSTISQYDFAIARHRETMIVKDCHGSQYDIRQTSTACGRGYFV
jgi:hypothetical protein